MHYLCKSAFLQDLQDFKEVTMCVFPRYFFLFPNCVSCLHSKFIQFVMLYVFNYLQASRYKVDGFHATI